MDKFFRVINKAGEDQCGVLSEDDARRTCNEMNRVHKDAQGRPLDEFNVIGLPVVYGPAFDRAQAARRAVSPPPPLPATV